MWTPPKDSADTEFARVKTALTQYRKLSNVESQDYMEIKNSRDVEIFGNKYLSKPKCSKEMVKRTFLDLSKVEIENYKNTFQKSKTIEGITRKYQYMILPNEDILWRRYPCFCDNCRNLNFELCQFNYICGKMESIKGKI